MSSIRRLLSFAGPYRWLSLAGCALSAVNSLLTMGVLVCVWFALRDLVAVAPRWDEAPGLASYGYLALGLAVAGLAVYFAGLMCTHLAAFRCARRMRQAALDHLARVPLGYFDVHSTGELRRVIEGSTGLTETVLAHRLPDFVGALTTPVAFVVLMFVFDWVLGLVCLVPILVAAGCMVAMMGGSADSNANYLTFMRNYQNALVAMNKAAVEYVRGIPVVKVFQQTAHSFKAFRASVDDYAAFATSYVDACRPLQVAQVTAINATFCLLVPAGILLAGSAGDFGAFFTDFLFYAVFTALTALMMNKVMHSTQTLGEAQDALGRIDAILAAPVQAEPAHPEPLPTGPLCVEFSHVTFTYPETSEPALRDVSLTVPAGATAALVGPSGGGKTTAASLVPRFWSVDAGAVRLGSVNVNDVASEQLMANVAFVFQNERLFKQSVFENVLAGRPSATRAEVLAALSAAQCDDIVAKLPQGIRTMLGAGGAYLSGGEVQRVALARAILKDAPIVVLDEATAFADPENEALIQRALTRLAAGRTVIMIAHRLSTVVGADKIVVLDRGRVAESGSHQELLSAGGLYARMWADYERAASWKISSEAATDAGAAAREGGEA